MASSNQVVKLKFRKQIPAMLEQAGVFKTLFSIDQVALSAIDPDLTVSWGVDFASWIEEAETCEVPWSAKGAMMSFTEEATRLMKQARNAMQELFFYVRRAFPDSAGKMEAYGKKDYREASKSRGKMLLVMERVTRNLIADQAAMIAAGYSLPKITAFGDLYNALLTTDNGQNTQKAAILDVTAAYYTKLNKVWAAMVKLSEASKLAFKDDYGKWKSYLLHTTVKSKKRKPKKEIPLQEAVSGVESLGTEVMAEKI